MSKAQNNHLHLISPISTASKLLKFCYFITAFLLVGCGGDKTEKTTETQSETQTEDVVTTDTSTKTILCFGDSITAGYGLDDTNDAFPGVLQQKIDSLNLNYTIVNSGVSGETTAGGKGRIDWILNQDIDIFLLELGANDGLRGVNLVETATNLQSIIDAVKSKSPKTKIILAGMQLPPNMGQEYTRDFKQIFMNIAEKNDLAFIPFILKDVGGIKELNQNDGIHPTVEGHKILANTVWEVLKPLL
ncbi:arylesterase [Winogradskyella thalassocola]|uniref:Acyl-CoA thioesterase-1 n=1 Tax=Winogradskyella thalassocola TaxID=262004 RepID=A0A1G8E2W4_9FLAO|nr:arylesterase [Winogradskyella thalassocola]SDH64214.1 acyl-CoA thioesterase-1 [Winogradskyella thalassocola]